MADDLRMLFCADPLNASQPDPTYAEEMAAAERIGIDCDLIRFESLVDDQDAERAVRRVKSATAPTPGVYRGWMLRPEHYGSLYRALDDRGVTLINDPAEYALCHSLPNWYSILDQWTPKSTWLTLEGDLDVDALKSLVEPFNGGPVIVKDFVKSQKHRWAEACFIPSSADTTNVERVVRRFLELQGPDLNEGLVLREFEEFEPLTAHPRSGMPLTREYRLFFLNQIPLVASEYWEEGDYEGPTPPLDQFQAIAARIQSRFFTMDVAQRRAGDWRIVELGDGQVAGLPPRVDPAEFIRALVGHLVSTEG